ncbi:MAG: hypothetical protein JST42_16155 [Bacteroidetes bacterium]|nr:hypothetical protein [Bacteroidota bacterium]
MKKLHLAAAAFLLLALVVGQKADAQAPQTVSAGSLLFVNTRALRNFGKSYSSAVDAEWQALKDGGWQVRFVSDSIRYRALYSGKGNWLFTIGSYNENRLPRDVRSIVKTTYYDYAITYIDEVSAPGQPTTYLVQIQDEKAIKILQVADGEMETLRELVKLAAR